MRELTSTEIFMALCVDVIRRLWNRDMYRQNKWLRMCHDEWFDVWTIWRTHLTMDDVDRQVEELNPDPVQFDKPIHWEEEHGETSLGGAMGISHEFYDHDA